MRKNLCHFFTSQHYYGGIPNETFTVINGNSFETFSEIKCSDRTAYAYAAAYSHSKVNGVGERIKEKAFIHFTEMKAFILFIVLFKKPYAQDVVCLPPWR